MKTSLIEQYETICNQIVQEFEKKQGLEFDGWIGDEVGGIASFISQYFFNMSDLVLDLKTKQKKFTILGWQDESVDYNMHREEQYTINYASYIKGMRYKDLKQ